MKVIEDPCKNCLINTICYKMCEKAKPYYQGLVVEDKNFNENEYEQRRDRLLGDLMKEDEKDLAKAREKRDQRRDRFFDDLMNKDFVKAREKKEKEISDCQLTLLQKLLKSQVVVHIRKKFKELFQGVC